MLKVARITPKEIGARILEISVSDFRVSEMSAGGFCCCLAMHALEHRPTTLFDHCVIDFSRSCKVVLSSAGVCSCCAGGLNAPADESAGITTLISEACWWLTPNSDLERMG
uniref:Uncharacterized protein n=1 Tax=Opuntia streptacantha TaxID=393608 RepID=A0A7C9AHV9_OPUST